MSSCVRTESGCAPGRHSAGSWRPVIQPQPEHVSVRAAVDKAKIVRLTPQGEGLD
jgi:hypothetical protein